LAEALQKRAGPGRRKLREQAGMTRVLKTFGANHSIKKGPNWRKSQWFVSPMSVLASFFCFCKQRAILAQIEQKSVGKEMLQQ
jgi:hypothetical protein